MATYKTPGVYVEEISTLPPSVAEVSTAVPAFLGYTESGSGVARVDTLLEYEELFGGANAGQFTATVAEDGSVSVASTSTDAAYSMYYALSHYFKNGGGGCYIVSVGNYGATPAKADFEAGLAEIEKEDEPTLIVLTDGVLLSSADYLDLCQQSLAQCNKLGDRFAILDVPDGDVDAFRDGLGTNHLKYAAAYHPYVHTTLAYSYSGDGVAIEGLADTWWVGTFGDDGVEVRFDGDAGSEPKAQVVQGDGSLDVTFEIAADALKISNVSGRTGADIVAAWTTWVAVPNDAAGFTVTAVGTGGGELRSTGNSQEALALGTTLSGIQSTETSVYSSVVTALAAQTVTLPPSAAIAGVYASVDRDRGVWKAPANVSLASVTGPVEKITHDEQESLNVDATGGKSINAIRAFTGKGVMVWGARTLAGNDNEWRYISVRRLFNVIEESTRKATAFAVFEPNDQTTWLKVKGMIEGYLYGLWERGALAGSTPDAAYFVNVGLGKTMTTQDVLEGRMNVEIGVAAVRPAEFIILRFTHKLQEA